MKKLNKLQFNSEKMLQNEELITLRGGYYSCCICYSNGRPMGIMNAWGQEDCTDKCGIMGWDGHWGNCSFIPF